MFYSHEVLTSRKYGVATIWLVATLGQKSSVKKVSRRKMQEVDVPKACEVIITPAVPMALRLSANLLFGVSRVYDQQCNYVLDEARHIHNNMRAMLKVFRIDEVVDGSNRAKPGHLALLDDPAFFPTIDFDALALDLLNTTTLETQESHLSTLPPRSQSSQAAVAMELPSQSSMSPAVPGSLGGSVSGRGLGLAETLARLDDDEGLMPDLDISIDFDGNILDTTTGQLAPGSTPIDQRTAESQPHRLAPTERTGRMAVHDSAVIDVGNGHEGPMTYDSTGANIVLHDQQLQTLSSEATIRESPHITARQARQPRAPKPLPFDRITEIGSRDIIHWQSAYLENMDQHLQAAHVRKAHAQAKKIAQYWIYGQGLNRIGLAPDVATIPSALDFFTGTKLLEWITGADSTSIARRERKRSSEEIEDSQLDEEERRRQRRRLDEAQAAQMGRAIGDDDGIQMFGDDTEIGRTGGEALEDGSTTMPWNISASIRGSSVARGAGPSVGPSAARASSTGLSARRRLVSESPLTGRGPRLSAILGTGPLQETLQPSDQFVSASEAEGFGPMPSSDVGVHDAGIDVIHSDPQLAVRASLSDIVSVEETERFLSFVEDGINDKRARLQLEAEDPEAATIDSIEFEELVPPDQRNSAVAARAFINILTLGSRDLLHVVQAEPFATINISLVSAA